MAKEELKWKQHRYGDGAIAHLATGLKISYAQSLTSSALYDCYVFGVKIGTADTPKRAREFCIKIAKSRILRAKRILEGVNENARNEKTMD